MPLSWLSQNIVDYPGIRPAFLNSDDPKARYFIGWEIPKSADDDLILGLTARHLIIVHHDDIIREIDNHPFMKNFPNRACYIQVPSIGHLKRYLKGEADLDRGVFKSTEHTSFVKKSRTHFILVITIKTSTKLHLQKHFIIPRFKKDLIDHHPDTQMLYDIGKRHGQVQREVLQRLQERNVSFTRQEALSSSQACCAVCFKTINVQKCSGCQQIYYCCRQHQKDHWKEHKFHCQFHSKSTSIFQQMKLIDETTGKIIRPAQEKLHESVAQMQSFFEKLTHDDAQPHD